MIIVFGSLTVDLFFATPTLPSEGTIQYVPRYDLFVGGRGCNQAYAAFRAGGTIKFYSQVGQDYFGDFVRQHLWHQGMDVGGIAQQADAQTPLAIIMHKGGQATTLSCSGSNATLADSLVPAAAFNTARWLLLPNSVPLPTTLALMQRAKTAGVKVAFNFAPINPAPTPAMLHGLVDLWVLNRYEAQALASTLGLTAATPLTPTTAAALALQCVDRLAATVVITLDKDGAVAATGKKVWSQAPYPITVVDAVGAGDCFLGTLVAWLDNNATLPEALRAASVAGALACTALGAQSAVPDVATLAAALTAWPVTATAI